MQFRWIQDARIKLSQNPHLTLSTLLFIAGIEATYYNSPILAGALFGAGASLLGVGITEWNNRQTKANEKARSEAGARQYLAAELNRTIEKVLYIHDRAVPNFGTASRECKSGKNTSLAIPGDQKQDFRPVMPVLYPHTPFFQNLSGDDANALIAYYDSLHNLDSFVESWWERDGQLAVNIFNQILHLSSQSLNLALVCVDRFSLEALYPPPYERSGTLTARIQRSLDMGKLARELHIKLFEKKTSGK